MPCLPTRCCSRPIARSIARRPKGGIVSLPDAVIASTELVTLDDLEAAARTLAPVAVRTPLLPADAITDAVGAPVFLKPEMLQRGGAFKFRGAYNFLARMDPDV